MTSSSASCYEVDELPEWCADNSSETPNDDQSFQQQIEVVTPPPEEDEEEKTTTMDVDCDRTETTALYCDAHDLYCPLVVVPSLPFGAASELVEAASHALLQEHSRQLPPNTTLRENVAPLGPSSSGVSAGDNSCSQMEARAAQILRTRHLVSALSRPVPASLPRLRSLVACAATLKLDGVRAILLVSPSRVEVIIKGVNKVMTAGVYQPLTDPLSVIDCEVHEDTHIYALDLMIFDDRDVRHRTLAERLQGLTLRLPPHVSLKTLQICNQRRGRSCLCCRSL